MPTIHAAKAPSLQVADPAALNRVVVGTAGHIDHGKTQLLAALTGIDCDRWEEEKKRGITIDLGFAHRLEGDLQIGFVDVPGHRRFLDNALAGLGGIRVALLVIAATEGVMPQTREHLAICSLLGIPSAVVALTKVDLCDRELVELATLDIEELLEQTPFAGAPIVPVSAVTGHGLDSLEAVLFDAARRNIVPPDPISPARLPIDRAFHLKGLGVVVTGTLAAGRIAVGDVLEAAPGTRQARVRNIHVHGQARTAAERGERTSLQLAGVELADVGRGIQLVTPGSHESATVLLTRTTLLPSAPAPLEGSTDVRIHLFASETLARARPIDPPVLEPGGEGLVELRLREPLPVVRGDRFVLRRPSPQATVGGGEVLDPSWPKRRREWSSEQLPRLETLPATVELWIERARHRGVTADELARRTGLAPRRIETILDELTARATAREIPAGQGSPARWVTQGAVDHLRNRAVALLEDHYRRHRLADGMAKADFSRRLAPAVPGHVAAAILRWLVEAGDIELREGTARLPGRCVELSSEESALVEPLTTCLEQAGLRTPGVDALREELGAELGVFDRTSRYLVDTGILVRLPNREVVAASAFEALRRDLLETGWERFDVTQFKDRFGLTRKWAIPLLEYCDSIGLTRRVGNDRLVSR